MDILTIPEKRPSEDAGTTSDVKRFKQGKDNIETSSFDFTVKTWKEDFVLIVENNRLYVTKAILACASPVFDRIFQADFIEKNLSELELPGKKFEDVKHFLRCIYPCPIDVDQENVKSILPLAEEYQVTNLKSKCEACLRGIIDDEHVSSNELYNVLELASLYNMSDLMVKCIERASKMSLESLLSAEGRMTIQPKVKSVILEKMVSKLRPNKILKVVQNYYDNVVKRDEKLDIEDYQNWDGKSLKFSADLNKSKLCKFYLFGISTEFGLEIQEKGNLFNGINLDTKIDKTEDHDSSFDIVGVVVIRPVVNMYEDITKQLRFSLCGGTEESRWLGGCQNKGTVGYIYHGKVDVELHVLANRR